MRICAVKGLFNINSRGHNLTVVSLLVVRIISLYQYIVIIVYNINCNHGDVFFLYYNVIRMNDFKSF